MFDENDRSSHPDDTSRHIRRGARHEDDKTIEVDSSAFFAPEVPQPQSPPPKPPRNNPPLPQGTGASPGAQDDHSGRIDPETRRYFAGITGNFKCRRSGAAVAHPDAARAVSHPHHGAAGAALAAGQALPGVQDPGRCVPVFSLFLCAGLAVGCVWAQQGLAALDNVTSGLITGAEANKITKEPFVVYLSGVDNRGELTEKARSDVNILAVVNPETKQVALINTPRDYYVDLAGTDSKDKLTHAGLYGVETSMATLGNLYGVNVEHYIRINFAGFISIIDAIGGVDVYSDQAFTSVGSPGYYDPTTFAEGWNHLDGKSALAFARERHAFKTGDIQRGINQMKVIDAMAEKLKSPALLMSFSKLMDAMADCFVTSLSQEQISALVRMQLSDLSSWDIQSYSVTGTGAKSSKCYSAKGQSLYVMKPDENSVNEAKALVAAVLGGEDKLTSTSQTPEKTDVHTPTADPNAAVSVPEETPDSVIVEEPAESVPEETPADGETTPETPADGEQSASTEAPAESEAQPAQSGETGGESPAISMPSQEQLEQAASSLHQAASTVLDALFGSSSSSEATDPNAASDAA